MQTRSSQPAGCYGGRRRVADRRIQATATARPAFAKATAGRPASWSGFDLAFSSFIRHSGFVIRHLTGTRKGTVAASFLLTARLGGLESVL